MQKSLVMSLDVKCHGHYGMILIICSYWGRERSRPEKYGELWRLVYSGEKLEGDVREGDGT